MADALDGLAEASDGLKSRKRIRSCGKTPPVAGASNLRTNPVLTDRANGAWAGRAVLSALMGADEPPVRDCTRLGSWSGGRGAAAPNGSRWTWSIQHRPAVGLVDVHLPVRAGDGLMARPVAIAPVVAVAAMSSENNHGIGRFLQEPGAVRYGLKPVPRERSTRMIGEAPDRLLAVDAPSSRAVGSDPAQRRPGRGSRGGPVTGYVTNSFGGGR